MVNSNLTSPHRVGLCMCNGGRTNLVKPQNTSYFIYLQLKAKGVLLVSYSLLKEKTCRLEKVAGRREKNPWLQLDRRSECFLLANYMKLTWRKHPDCLADSYKHLNVNWMAAGSRQSRYNHGFIFPSCNFFTPTCFSAMVSKIM